MTKKDWSSFLLLKYCITVSAYNLQGSCCIIWLDTISLKNGTLLHLKWHLFLFNFRFSWWQICMICLNVWHGSCIHHHNIQLEYHLLYQTHLVAPWGSHIFFTGTSHPLVHLQVKVLYNVHTNWQAKAVNINLWLLEHYVLVLLNTLLDLAGSKHRQTVPMAYVPVQSCCANQTFCWLPVGLLIFTFVGVPILLWMVPEACMPFSRVEHGMSLQIPLSSVNMCNWSTHFLKNDYICHAFSVILVLAAMFTSLSGPVIK